MCLHLSPGRCLTLWMLHPRFRLSFAVWAPGASRAAAWDHTVLIFTANPSAVGRSVEALPDDWQRGARQVGLEHCSAAWVGSGAIKGRGELWVAGVLRMLAADQSGMRWADPVTHRPILPSRKTNDSSLARVSPYSLTLNRKNDIRPDTGCSSPPVRHPTYWSRLACAHKRRAYSFRKRCRASGHRLQGLWRIHHWRIAFASNIAREPYTPKPMILDQFEEKWCLNY